MKTKFLFLLLLSVAFAGCDQITTAQPPPESTVRVEMRQNEQNQQRLSTAVPAPVVKTSIERKNLKNPWNIIGWGVVLVAGCVAAIAGAFVVGLLIAMARRMARRKRALRTAPAEGQVWMQDERRLYINEVRDGRVFIKTDGAFWSDSIAEWKNRVRNRNLTLVHEA